MKTYLSNFDIQRPAHIVDQAALADWLSSAHAAAEERATGASNPDFELLIQKLIARFGCKPSQIAFRGTDVPDVLGKEHRGNGLYAVKGDARGPNGADIHERNLFFAAACENYFSRFYDGEKTAPDHIVHVSCTGYVAPSPAQKYVARRNWIGGTDVTHAYHMGCYASIPAVRMARGFLAAGQSRADIVHSEMCTLHLNPLDHRPEQLVVQSLFADGHIKYSVTNDVPQHAGFEVLDVLEWIVPDSADAMTWIPTAWGMQMTLSRDVPERIASRIKPFLETLLKKSGDGGIETISKAKFAIHPGGPKIIDSLATLLELGETQIEHSRGVLGDFGNMSSATLPHVWSRMSEDKSIASGERIISLAFGPGLTIFGAVMRKL